MKLFSALLFLAISIPAFGDSEAARLARKARKAQSAKQLSQAYLYYVQAATLDPGNKSYRAKANLLRAEVASQAKPPAVSYPVSDTPILSPDDVFDSLGSVNLKPAAELHPRPGRFDIDLDGDYKVLFQQVATLFQLECVFDSDYEPGRRMRLSLTQADYRDALLGLSAATNSFVIPLADKLFVVAKDTPQKRTDLEQAMSVTVRIPEYVSVQELVELAQAVRQASGVEKLSWDNKTGSVIMRDRVSRVIPAEELFRNLLSYRPEVMIDLQLIQIARSDIVNYGINLPNVFNIAFTGQKVSSSGGSSLASDTSNPFPFNSLSYIFTALGTQTSSTLAQSIVRGLFPTSLSVFSISIGEANALLNFSQSRGKTVLSENLRSADSQAATFHYGERYPILTGSFNTSATVGTQSVPLPSFTYEDLGVTLKLTPHIHGMDAVSLDIESEFKLLSGSSVNGNPIISNRKLKSTVSLEEDQWAVVAGLQQNTNTRSVAGTAGVSSIPVFSPLFSQHMNEKDRSEILILMRPHLLDLPANQRVTKDVWVGTETRPYTPL